MAFRWPLQTALLARWVAHTFVALSRVLRSRNHKARQHIDAQPALGTCSAAHKYLAVVAILWMKLQTINGPLLELQKKFGLHLAVSIRNSHYARRFEARPLLLAGLAVCISSFWNLLRPLDNNQPY